MTSAFLKAEWRKLAMANYTVDPSILLPYLPKHTELDLWNGRCYVSLVGFMFLNTKLKGIKVPLHINFEEVNLRFYVRYNDAGEWKRGVVFISEIVPKAALSFVANTIYGEHYETMSMRHDWQENDQSRLVEYRWKKNNHWNTFQLSADLSPIEMEIGSEEEFITEHFWGYTKRKKGFTSEYGVEHPRWQVYPVQSYHIDADFEELYGADFAFLQQEIPVSVLLAEGSEIIVRKGKRIRQ
jgi:uncharacterized protein YqjF (DUF2071 family)